MKVLRAASVLLLSSFVLAGCGDDDDPAGVEIADFTGAWTATQFEYEENGGAGLSIDAIGPLVGGTVTLDVLSSGAFTGQVRIPGLTVDGTGETITVPIGGTFGLVTDDILSADFDAATEALGLFEDFQAEFDLNGDVLTFVNDDTEFDFPDQLEASIPGVGARPAVPATLTVRLVR
ncbi:MAG: hypothetical protein P8177_10915 [Gemmatimonadota bacterium]|jgi:hypothetical protein